MHHTGRGVDGECAAVVAPSGDHRGITQVGERGMEGELSSRRRDRKPHKRRLPGNHEHPEQAREHDRDDQRDRARGQAAGNRMRKCSNRRRERANDPAARHSLQPAVHQSQPSFGCANRTDMIGKALRGDECRAADCHGSVPLGRLIVVAYCLESKSRAGVEVRAHEDFWRLVRP